MEGVLERAEAGLDLAGRLECRHGFQREGVLPVETLDQVDRWRLAHLEGLCSPGQQDGG